MLDLVVRVLPDVVREASAPLGNVDRLTVISTDGASDLTRTVAAQRRAGAADRQRPDRASTSAPCCAVSVPVRPTGPGTTGPPAPRLGSTEPEPGSTDVVLR